ncbi:hypothetical protein ANN_09127 [Periplaneta americana]|uniref:Uncharacterized protein n=1 Tax=Periplaneta americana TaxID=6978 RepID=A0ABQ8TLX8_PERAM|nr:hypothetical protein ANN_09127 [Periplaneta americana]
MSIKACLQIGGNFKQTDSIEDKPRSGPSRRSNRRRNTNLGRFAISPNKSLTVRTWLDEQFPGHWLGRRGPVEWPARSPDLTPLDFYLWGHLKSLVYGEKIRFSAHLQTRIIEACSQITPNIIQHVLQDWMTLLRECTLQNGEHIEHITRYMVSRETLRRYATRRSETNTNGTELDSSESGIVLGRCLNTSALRCPHIKISKGARSGDRAGQGTSPREEIKRPENICLKLGEKSELRPAETIKVYR